MKDKQIVVAVVKVVVETTLDIVEMFGTSSLVLIAK